MRASGKAGMTDDQIADFVSRFMPAYKAYLPQLYSQGPTTARQGRNLVIQVDENRSPVANQPASVICGGGRMPPAASQSSSLIPSISFLSVLSLGMFLSAASS